MVAAVIFSIATVGVFATIGSIRKPASKTDRSLEAAYIAQQTLESMRNNVDALTWDTGPLSVGTHNLADIVRNGITYSISYTVVEDATSKARKVTVNVNWPDT